MQKWRQQLESTFPIPQLRELQRTIQEQSFRFRITLEGILFVVVTLAIGLAAMNTGAQLLFLVFSMMCAFWVFSAILADASMRRLQIKRHLPREAVMLEPAIVRFSVTNTKKRWASSSLRIADYLEGERLLGAAFVSQVNPGETVETSYQVVFPNRGRYKLRTIHVISHYPFGWIKRAFPRLLPAEILVLPSTLSITTLLENAQVDLGDMGSPRKGRGTGLHTTRNYVPGESIRDVHWKLSARSNKLIVREYENEEFKRASVIFDNRLPAKVDAEAASRFEAAITLTASVLKELIQRGFQVELITASGRVGFDQRPNHLNRCLRSLALLESVPLETGTKLPSPGDRSAVVVQVETPENASGLAPQGTRVNVMQFLPILEEALQKAPRATSGKPLTMETMESPALA